MVLTTMTEDKMETVNLFVNSLLSQNGLHHQLMTIMTTHDKFSGVVDAW